MEIISLREYARRIGVSLPAVQRAAKPENGRIQVIRDANGKITGIDWDTQEAAWLANSKAPNKRPHNISGGRPRKDGQQPAKPAAKTIAKNAEPEPSEGEFDGEIQAPATASGGVMSITEIQRARELVKLQIDNLKLQEAKGEVLPIAEVRTKWFKLVKAAQTRILGIPAECKQRVSDLPLSAVAAIETVCREALEDLANERDEDDDGSD